MSNANSVTSPSFRSSPVTSIQRAADATGLDFDYLVSQAEIESAMNPNAKAGTSTAAGLFQFTQQTWLATVEKHGHKAGLEWAQDAIQRDTKGSYFVANPTTRKTILDLRYEPEPASRMAAYFALDNQQHLKSSLGIEPTPTDLYMAHFLGAGGAVKFLSEMAKNPNASAASIFPEAAAANRNIFYTKSGAPRSLSQVYGLLNDKLDKAGDKWVPGGFEPGRQPIMYANAAAVDNSNASSANPTDNHPNQIAIGPIPVLPIGGYPQSGAALAIGPTAALPTESPVLALSMEANATAQGASISPNQAFPYYPAASDQASLQTSVHPLLDDYNGDTNDVGLMTSLAGATQMPMNQLVRNNPTPSETRPNSLSQPLPERSFSTIDALAAVRFEPMPNRLSIDFARSTYSRLAQI